MSLDPIKLLAAGFSKSEIVAMMSAKTASPVFNTKQSVYTPISDNNIRGALQRARAKFKTEPLETVSIARPYGKLVGGYLKVGINGVVIELPCDGKKYKVPKSFALAIETRLENLDIMDSDKGPSMGETETSSYFKEGGLVSGAEARKIADVTHG